MSLILSGPVLTNAGELFSTGEVVKFLDYCREKYEYIIIDSPPLLPVSDSLAVAKLSDTILIVVRAGVTRIAQLQGIVTRIRNIDAVPLGAVLNMIPEDARDYDDYGYQYEYSRYGYKGYLYKKYSKRYGDDYGYSQNMGYVPKTYPPLIEDEKKSRLWKDLSE